MLAKRFGLSSAFDRVWLSGLLYKITVVGEFLNWFKDYLTDSKQHAFLPNATSDWTFIRAGVPQGSMLGPLLFLFYVNDFVNDIGSNTRLFADDTSVFIIVNNPVLAAECLSSYLNKLLRWAATWLITFNPSKIEVLLFSRKLDKPKHPPLLCIIIRYQK